MTLLNLPRELPAADARKIDGKASYYRRTGALGISLYNGSNWSIVAITVRLEVKPGTDVPAMNRLFRQELEKPLMSLTSGYVSINTGNNALFSTEQPKFSWQIVSVTGTKE